MKKMKNYQAIVASAAEMAALAARIVRDPSVVFVQILVSVDYNEEETDPNSPLSRRYCRDVRHWEHLKGCSNPWDVNSESLFERCNWISEPNVLDQLDILELGWFRKDHVYHKIEIHPKGETRLYAPRVTAVVPAPVPEDSTNRTLKFLRGLKGLMEENGVTFIVGTRWNDKQYLDLDTEDDLRDYRTDTLYEGLGGVAFGHEEVDNLIRTLEERV